MRTQPVFLRCNLLKRRRVVHRSVFRIPTRPVKFLIRLHLTQSSQICTNSEISFIDCTSQYTALNMEHNCNSTSTSQYYNRLKSDADKLGLPEATQEREQRGSGGGVPSAVQEYCALVRRSGEAPEAESFQPPGYPYEGQNLQSSVYFVFQQAQPENLPSETKWPFAWQKPKQLLAILENINAIFAATGNYFRPC